MHTQTKLLMATLTAALALSIGVTTANALRSLGISETRLSLTGRVTFTASLGELICSLTFEKTVSAAIPKRPGTDMGKITNITTRECRLGGGFSSLQGFTILNLARAELWRLSYTTFLGTLPEISGVQIQIRNPQLLLAFTDIFTQRYGCLYEGNTEILEAIERRVIGRLRDVERQNVMTLRTDLRLGGTCPATLTFRLELTPVRAPTISLL
jgi:hypothetical protein